MDKQTGLEAVLHRARALVLADLAADGFADAAVVSLVEDAVAQRRWWVEQWPDGAEFVAGLVAQDVQDGLADRFGRHAREGLWPLCPQCDGGPVHALHIEPDLGGPDPTWVCEESGVAVAPLGSLSHATAG